VKTIIYGIDGSPDARSALRVAAAPAQRMSAAIDNDQRDDVPDEWAGSRFRPAIHHRTGDVGACVGKQRFVVQEAATNDYHARYT
jgi:hypothetical protein